MVDHRPLAFEVTEASRRDPQPQAQWLLDQMPQRHPELLGRCSRLSADKGDGPRHQPAVAIASDQADHRHSQLLEGCGCGGRWRPHKLVNGQKNVIYTYDGEVSCVCPLSGEVHSMTYGGFERDRETLKYRCPARYSGITCQGMEQWPLAGKAVRIPLAAGSPGVHAGGAVQLPWQDYYDERSAVERVNSRLAGGFGFERPGIRGLAKMQLRITMALTISWRWPWGGSGPANPSTCGVWSNPPPERRLRAGHQTKSSTGRTGCAAPPVCPELAAEPR